MTTGTRVSLTVAPEAAAHVADLGMRRELDRMLDHTRESVPRLRSIAVALAHDPEGADEPRIVIEAGMEPGASGYDSTEDEWGRWKVETFPPAVSQHFVLLTVYGNADGR
jgi:hypothetical protein